MDQCQYGVSVSYTAQGTLIPLRERPRRNIKYNYRGVEDSVLFQEMMQVNVPLQVHKESQ